MKEKKWEKIMRKTKEKWLPAQCSPFGTIGLNQTIIAFFTHTNKKNV